MLSAARVIHLFVTVRKLERIILSFPNLLCDHGDFLSIHTVCLATGSSVPLILPYENNLDFKFPKPGLGGFAAAWVVSAARWLC